MTEKILIVEDDTAALRLVSYTLESSRYQVVSAVNGVEGVRKAQPATPEEITAAVHSLLAQREGHDA